MTRRRWKKKVPGFRGYYANEHGEIVSFARGRERALRPRPHHRTGHLRVRLYYEELPERQNGKRWADYYVHVLVCRTWHGEPPEGMEIVLHLDDDPMNNRPSNLRWGTRSENERHKHRTEKEREEDIRIGLLAWEESTTDVDGFDWSTGEQV